MSIKIITRLSPDCCNGEVIEIIVGRTGPLSLLRALDQLLSVKQKRIEQFGNIGCGSTWIAIDGVIVTENEFNEYLDVCEQPHNFSMYTKTKHLSRMSFARYLIEQIQTQANKQCAECA